MRRAFLVAVAGIVAAGMPRPAAAADPVTTYEVAGAVEDVAFVLESAIIGRGLVIDHVSRVGEMLNRTGEDIGAAQDIYTQADVYQFCSTVLSRKMMEADPDNIAHCPYSVFLYELAERPGTVHVGYRNLPEGEMQQVEALLDAIAREAVGSD